MVRGKAEPYRAGRGEAAQGASHPLPTYKLPFPTCKLPYALFGFHTVSTAAPVPYSLFLLTQVASKP